MERIPRLDKNVKETVELIAAQYLCNSCGACAVVCPTGAISWGESVGGYVRPEVNGNKCIECGMCLKVCSGIHFGNTLTTMLSFDPFVGAVQECYLGKALNDEIYRLGQSGGVVTALLRHALRQGIVQGAVVVVSRPGRPPKFEPIIATSEAQLRTAQGSKYVPIPVLSVLNEAKQQKLKVALVGLACHVHGLYNLFDLRPDLEKLVPLKIGLICERVMTKASVDFLVKRAGLSGEICELRFRSKQEAGWPGVVRISTLSGKSITLSNAIRINIKDWFTPVRCRLCFDKLNVFADLSVGDPWGISAADKISGESILIVRTLAGKELLESAVEHGEILVRPVRSAEVIKGQKIEQRRRDWVGYCEAWKALGRELPDYYERIRKYTPKATFESPHYIHQLQHSLSLDGFSSREALLQYVGRRLFARAVKRWIFFPGRVARAFARGTRHWIGLWRGEENGGGN